MAWLKILLAAPVSYGAIAALGLVPNPVALPSGPTNPAANTALIGPLPELDRADARPGRGDPRRKVRRAADGLFYVTARVNGTPVRFLVDTGANMVVLTRDDATRVGLPPMSANGGMGETMETAAGAAQIDRVTLAHVDVAGRKVRNVDAAVASGELKISLLGQNLLSRLGPVMLDGTTLVINAPTNAPAAGGSAPPGA